MLYFFHHYELPAILQQERIQQIVTNQQNNQGTQTQIGNNAQPDANHNTEQNTATNNTMGNTATNNTTHNTATLNNREVSLATNGEQAPAAVSTLHNTNQDSLQTNSSENATPNSAAENATQNTATTIATDNCNANNGKTQQSNIACEQQSASAGIATTGNTQQSLAGQSSYRQLDPTDRSEMSSEGSQLSNGQQTDSVPSRNSAQSLSDSTNSVNGNPPGIVLDENASVKNFGDMKHSSAEGKGSVFMSIDSDSVRGEFGASRDGGLCDGSSLNSNSCSSVDSSLSSGKLSHSVCSGETKDSEQTGNS